MASLVDCLSSASVLMTCAGPCPPKPEVVKWVEEEDFSLGAFSFTQVAFTLEWAKASPEEWETSMRSAVNWTPLFSTRGERVRCNHSPAPSYSARPAVARTGAELAELAWLAELVAGVCTRTTWPTRVARSRFEKPEDVGVDNA